MPDFLEPEETKNRRQSLCLYNVPGITFTSNRRCDNCPGAARTPDYHQRRCPLDISNDCNLFTQAAAAQAGKSEAIVDPKLLASSSSSSSNAEQHVNENVAVATISDEIQDISLDERSQPSGRCPARLDSISSPSTDRPVSDPRSEVIGRKRKADDWSESSSRDEPADFQGEEFSRSPKLHRTESIVQGLHSLSIAHDDDQPGSDVSLETAVVTAGARVSLNQPEGSPRAEQARALANVTTEVNERTRSNGDQLDGRSDSQEFLRNREPRIFPDRPDDAAALMMDWGINTSSRGASLSSLLAGHEGQDPVPPGLVSALGIRIPGIGLISAQRGVPPGNGGIFNLNDPQEFCFMMSAMELHGPSEEELRNE